MSPQQSYLKIVLVHGGCHGAWCWYKVVAILKSQGYSVTAVDLAACGSDPRRMGEDVSTFDEYDQPLMDLMASAAEGEKVVLVGHSFGGFSLAKAMEAFPEKIAVAIFVTAFLPDIVHSPFYIFEQLFQQSADTNNGVETRRVTVPGRSEPFTMATIKPEYLASNLYQNCSFERAGSESGEGICWLRFAGEEEVPRRRCCRVGRRNTRERRERRRRLKDKDFGFKYFSYPSIFLSSSIYTSSGSTLCLDLLLLLVGSTILNRFRLDLVMLLC